MFFLHRAKFCYIGALYWNDGVIEGSTFVRLTARTRIPSIFRVDIY